MELLQPEKTKPSARLKVLLKVGNLQVCIVFVVLVIGLGDATPNLGWVR